MEEGVNNKHGQGGKAVKSLNKIHNKWVTLQKINKHRASEYEKTISKTPRLLER